MISMLGALAAVTGQYLSSAPTYVTFKHQGRRSETVYELSTPGLGRRAEPSEWMAKVKFAASYGDPEEVLVFSVRACPAIFSVVQSLSTLPQAQPADPNQRVPSAPPIDGSSYEVSVDIAGPTGHGRMSYFVHHFGAEPEEGTIAGWVAKAEAALRPCFPAARAAARSGRRGEDAGGR